MQEESAFHSVRILHMKVPLILKKPFSYSTWKLRNATTGLNLGREWVEDHSPILVDLRTELSENRPFKGLNIGVCLPGTWEAFMYLTTLEFGGASLLYYPMSCRADVGFELSKRNSLR